MSAYSSFVVAGAGNLGRHLTEALIKKGFKVTVLSRSTSGAVVDKLAAAGAMIKAVDYEDAESVASAIRGSQVVVNTLAGEALMGPAQGILVEQIKKEGIQLYVPNDWGVDYTLLTEKNLAPPPMLAAKPVLAAELDKLGIKHLQIFNGSFASFVAPLLGIDKAAATGTIIGDGNVPFGATAEEDVGYFVAEAFANLPRSELENKTLGVAASTRYTANEVFKELEKRTGKKWNVTHLDVEETRKTSYEPSFPGFLRWAGVAVETGVMSHKDDNARVGFTPKIDPIDVILA